MFKKSTVSMAVITMALVAIYPGPSATRADESKRVLKIMTRNLDAGTDLNLIFTYPDLPSGVTATLNQVNSTDPRARAARLADEIRVTQPDFIGLQEATEWRTGTCGATAVLYDQLQLVLDALAARNMHYTKVAVQIFPTIEAPLLTAGQCLSFTDRNALLARTDLRPAGIEVSNVQIAQFQNYLDLTPMGLPKIYRGYISADVKAGNDSFRLVTTHMESTYFFDPTGDLQAAQAGELIGALNTTGMPVVLFGDFNSNAEGGPEQTPTVGMLTAAGLTDTWRQFYPMGTGYTWPLYYEDLNSGPAIPNERIDLIFTRGVRALKVDETGLIAPCASDHAGVVSMVQIGK
jgi:endonuclease/exonuclease/phosphatase family metal-dependent hydrolase